MSDCWLERHWDQGPLGDGVGTASTLLRMILATRASSIHRFSAEDWLREWPGRGIRRGTPHSSSWEALSHRASMAARSAASRSRLSEYQTQLPRLSPCTNPASLRIFRWWEIVG